MVHDRDALKSNPNLPPQRVPCPYRCAAVAPGVTNGGGQPWQHVSRRSPVTTHSEACVHTRLRHRSLIRSRPCVSVSASRVSYWLQIGGFTCYSIPMPHPPSDLLSPQRRGNGGMELLGSWGARGARARATGCAQNGSKAPNMMCWAFSPTQNLGKAPMLGCTPTHTSHGVASTK